MGLPLVLSRGGEPSDAELIDAARSADADALGALYDRHARALLAVAYRLLRDAGHAEDVVHDVFVGLPEALSRYQERGAFGAWLRKVTVRVALARLRALDRDSTTLDETAPVRFAGPEIEAVVSLEKAVDALPSSLRAVLMLKEVEGFSHREVAELLGISVGASEVRLHRALAALRRALHAEGES